MSWFETLKSSLHTLTEYSVCPYLSSRSLSLCSPSGTQGCVCETGVCGGFELLYMCCSFSSTTAGFNTIAILSFALFFPWSVLLTFVFSFPCSFFHFLSCNSFHSSLFFFKTSLLFHVWSQTSSSIVIEQFIFVNLDICSQQRRKGQEGTAQEIYN